MNKSDVLNKIVAVRDAVTAGENTATRVGGAMVDSLNYLTDKIEGKAGDSSPESDSFVYKGRILSTASSNQDGKEDEVLLNEWLDALPQSSTLISQYNGTLRINYKGTIISYTNYVQNGANNIWSQKIEGNITYQDVAKLGRKGFTFGSYNVWTRTYNGSAWSEPTNVRLLVNGTAPNINPFTISHKTLSDVTNLDSLNTLLDGMVDVTIEPNRQGEFRCTYNGSIFFIEQYAQALASNKFVQVVRGLFSVNTADKTKLTRTNTYNVLVRDHNLTNGDNGGWSEWKVK